MANIADVIQNCEIINQDIKLRTLCFTGHRSQKLPWKFNEKNLRCQIMKFHLKNAIKRAIGDGYTDFISGMALGFDMICAEMVLKLKKKNPNIKLECAIPCKNQEIKWNKQLQERYREILKQADKIWCGSENYNKLCMFERNKYMINNSSKVIALFDGKPGGTAQTLNYAKKKGLKIEIIVP